MKNQFGGKITPALERIYSNSNHWDGKKFLNLEATGMDINIRTLPQLLYKQIFQRQGRSPSQQLPVLPFDKKNFLAGTEKAKFVWYGHSVLLLRINNITVLVDPMLGPNAAPISPFSVPRFSSDTLKIIDELPPIDLMLLSHDHYDHLDYQSILRLIPKVGRYFVALGVGRHLESWGIDSKKIKEFDWWDDKIFGDINITFTPTRHFAGRGLSDRSKSLWGGWTFRTNTENIYFSGDSGYGEHFKEVGAKLGPFDFAFMECGQYDKYWHQIHMYPEESVLAALDAQAKVIMPVHWAGFALSLHPWKEPVERFIADAYRLGIPTCTPNLGALIELGSTPENKWWEQF